MADSSAVLDVPSDWRLVLASRSPRRRELLDRMGLHVEIRPADIDETPDIGESPVDYVRRLSVEKAAAVGLPGEIVVAADTTVELDGQILEKPIDRTDGRRMLRSLSGRSHRTHTGVTVVVPDSSWTGTAVVSTDVVFSVLDDGVIDWYLRTGEADDKAGGYGLQGVAAGFVERVDGSVTNVIGLPLVETLDLIRQAVRSVST
ncbi:MAG: nucleoside triphosphate pyrophosphatase [Ilumatobacter sp.]